LSGQSQQGQSDDGQHSLGVSIYHFLTSEFPAGRAGFRPSFSFFLLSSSSAVIYIKLRGESFDPMSMPTIQPMAIVAKRHGGEQYLVDAGAHRSRARIRSIKSSRASGGTPSKSSTSGLCLCFVYGVQRHRKPLGWIVHHLPVRGSTTVASAGAAPYASYAPYAATGVLKRLAQSPLFQPIATT
jgi:hypothetical protein